MSRTIADAPAIISFFNMLTSTQLLTYAQINETILTIPNYYAGIMRDLPMLFGIPFGAGPTQMGI